MYGPSLVRRVELGASKGAGGGKADTLVKLLTVRGADEDEATKVLAVDALEGYEVPVVVVSMEACEP